MMRLTGGLPLSGLISYGTAKRKGQHVVTITTNAHKDRAFSGVEAFAKSRRRSLTGRAVAALVERYDAQGGRTAGGGDWGAGFDLVGTLLGFIQ